MSGINLHFPQDLAEALGLLQELKDALILAGGTDLLVDYKQGLVQIHHLISLQGIKELKEIANKNNNIRIGAMVTPLEIISHPLLNEYIPALVEAARSMASPQIRSLATIGGNIASGVPSADFPPALMAADAAVELRCSRSRRKVSLLEFFTGPRDTVCREEELLTAILIAMPPPKTGISFQKFTLREANALAVASAASRLTLQSEKIDKATVVLGAVAPTPLLAKKTSEFLSGKVPSESLFKEAASIAKAEAKPISDIRGSIWYREELIESLVFRSLKEALSQVRNTVGEGEILR